MPSLLTGTTTIGLAEGSKERSNVMVTVIAEGVDYSSTANADWNGLAAALVAQGKHFAGRYAVSDKSPAGRGITNAEYRALMAHKIDVFLYYEETEAWMLEGRSAGVRAATRALDVIRSEGMPEGMPVRYSHDVDPTPDQFAALDACVNGAASVVGWDRVAFYGGYLAIDYLSHNTPIKRFCQTIAWQYQHGIHPAADLHQYNTGQPSAIFIGGANVDLVAQLKPLCGFASEYLVHPTTTTTLPPAQPEKRIPAPDLIAAQGHVLTPNAPNRFKAAHGGHFKTAPRTDAPNGTETPYHSGDGKTYTFAFKTTVDGEVWYVSTAGSWAPANHFKPG